MESQSEITQTVSALKLPVLKTGEYDLWSMRMEQYLTFTDHALWEVIVNGDSVSPIASASAGAECPIPPKTTKQKLARKNELKAKSTLMLAIPDEHLLKFHVFKDAKSLWEAIKNRFGGNKESKKMQKTILKQNYENFVASSQEGLDKTYDRFQKLISQLKIHGYLIVLESFEARRVVHEKNEAVYEENIAFSNYDVQVKDISIKDLKNQLEEALKEKDDLKLKLEKFEESSKKCLLLELRGEVILPENAGHQGIRGIEIEMIQEGMHHAKGKTSLGYDSQMNEGELNNIHMNESEMIHSVFNNRESDVDDSPVNDRFKTGEGFHAVPPPYTGNYMPLRPDLSFAGLDESVFQSAVRKTTTSVPKTETSISKTSKDTVEKPKTVRPSAPIIEE
ncbi:hypothetical protein Tco_0047830 [Tanacetum coccineum]